MIVATSHITGTLNTRGCSSRVKRRTTTLTVVKAKAVKPPMLANSANSPIDKTCYNNN